MHWLPFRPTAVIVNIFLSLRSSCSSFFGLSRSIHDESTSSSFGFVKRVRLFLSLLFRMIFFLFYLQLSAYLATSCIKRQNLPLWKFSFFLHLSISIILLYNGRGSNFKLICWTARFCFFFVGCRYQPSAVRDISLSVLSTRDHLHRLHASACLFPSRMALPAANFLDRIHNFYTSLCTVISAVR